MQDYPNVLNPDKWLNATFPLVFFFFFFLLRLRTGCKRSTTYKVSQIELFWDYVTMHALPFQCGWGYIYVCERGGKQTDAE